MAAAAAAVSPNGIKTLLANGLTTFPIKGKSGFDNGYKNLLEDPPDSSILCKWIFDNFILADEPFKKTLPTLKTCVLVNNNLPGELFSSL